MGKPESRPRTLLATLGTLLTATFTVAGCVSMPSGGAVQSAPVTQGQDAETQPYLQFQPSPPGTGWKPNEIVEGFLTASASLGDDGQVAREYLTPQASKAWKPSWSAIVYSKGPNVSDPAYQSTTVKVSKPKGGTKTMTVTDKATVTVTGKVQANLSGYGSYAVASAQNVDVPGSGSSPTFTLVKVGSQWRISNVPSALLLTSDSFKNDYQLRNLYFFDPTGQYLVPDPVYVPLQANAGLMLNGLVHDLINPPPDWLSGNATSTAFPAGTTLLGDVTMEELTAVVNLGGSITKITNARTKADVLEQVSSQLLATLHGAGQSAQTVQSIEVELNGVQWSPPGSQNNPVQRPPGKFQPATGATPTFYYLSPAGYLVRRNGLGGKPTRFGLLGSDLTQLAISPDGKYVAALNGSQLFTGVVGGKLRKRSGNSYLSISWDRNDELWATTSETILTLAGSSPASQAPVPVSVVSSNGTSVAGPFSALKVAPDGVRVVIIVGSGQALQFGAISWQGARSGQSSYQIKFSPFSVSTAATFFTAVSWYGPDDVITLAEPGPAVTEYPVTGGTATSIPGDSQMMSISASAGYPLLTGQTDNHVGADVSLTGSWMAIDAGSSPVYPG